MLLLTGLSTPVHANQTVTACGSDTQSGAGTNLATALAAGGDIFLQCPKASVIRITQRYTLNSETQIIGLNSSTLADNIVLDGAGLAGPFLFVASGKLTVQAVSFRNFTTGLIFSRVPSIAAAENVPTIDGTAAASYASVVDARGDVELDQVQITASNSPVRAAGAMTVNHSWFGNNKGPALYFLGVGAIDSSDFESNGQGIGFHKGSIQGSTFNGHTLSAIGIVLPTGGVTIRNCNFGNGTLNPAISITTQSSNSGSATITIRGDSFSSNDGGTDAGAIAVRLLTSPMAAAEAYFQKLPSTQFQIAYDDFDSNRGTNGGAVDLELRAIDSLSIVGGTFTHNTAITSGGALFANGGQMSVTHSLFKANNAPAGAAIATASTTQLIVANSLIVENVATASAPIPANQRAAITGPQLRLVNVTVANNQSLGVGSDHPGSSQFTNVILSQNQLGNCAGYSAGSFTGSNLQFGATGCGGSTSAQDPMLDSFYVPAPGSVALQLGNSTVCAASPVDGSDLVFQSRARQGVCALGAYERPPPQFKPPAPTQGPYAPRTVTGK